MTAEQTEPSLMLLVTNVLSLLWRVCYEKGLALKGFNCQVFPTCSPSLYIWMSPLHSWHIVIAQEIVGLREKNELLLLFLSFFSPLWSSSPLFLQLRQDSDGAVKQSSEEKGRTFISELAAVQKRTHQHSRFVRKQQTVSVAECKGSFQVHSSKQYLTAKNVSVCIKRTSYCASRACSEFS